VKPAETRLTWLDALRGLAVIGVLIDHGTYLVFPEVHQQILSPYFDIGTCGVMIFFLVSGYIVPASLERHGDLRRFWISRVFRLYPVWAVAIGAWLIYMALGVVQPDSGLTQAPVTWTAAHLTMMQDLLGVKNTINVLWTLSYEMAFYLVLTGLFLTRVHRRSGGFAVVLAAAALALGGILPQAGLSQGAAVRWVAIGAAVLLATGLIAVTRHAVLPRAVGGLLLGVLGAILVVVNSRMGDWESLFIPAVMFTGTAIYRAERGQMRWRTTIACAVTVLVLGIFSGLWHSSSWGWSDLQLRDFQISWVSALLVAAAIFTLGACRWRREAPRALVWFGTVSYSVYLLHPIAINAFRRIVGDQPQTMPFLEQVAVAIGFLALLLAMATLSYRYIERPAQRLGRRIAARKPPHAAHTPHPAHTAHTAQPSRTAPARLGAPVSVSDRP
jgi:peptidoglycan/LPS O-acetylase OafA/YrhL